MLPALRPGQIVLARKARRNIRPGDIIIIKHGVEKIKRVKSVEQHGYYVVGDNPTKSTDSRHFGVVSHTSVLGKVVMPGLLRRG